MSNKTLVLWAFLVTIIFSIILVIGLNFKKNSEYYEAEDLVKTATYNYLNDKKLLPEKGISVEITLNDLIEENYMKELYIKSNLCKGKVTIKKKIFKYSYDMDITCGNY